MLPTHPKDAVKNLPSCQFRRGDVCLKQQGMQLELKYRSAYHCVGWHAVVCYGAPEWYRSQCNKLSTKLYPRHIPVTAPSAGKFLVLSQASYGTAPSAKLMAADLDMTTNLGAELKLRLSGVQTQLLSQSSKDFERSWIPSGRHVSNFWLDVLCSPCRASFPSGLISCTVSLSTDNSLPSRFPRRSMRAPVSVSVSLALILGMS